MYLALHKSNTHTDTQNGLFKLIKKSYHMLRESIIPIRPIMQSLSVYHIQAKKDTFFKISYFVFQTT